MRGAVAGSTLIATTLLCAAIGLGLGALVGAPALLAIVGVFIGFALGFRLVYTRFKDI
jgi:F0F1-type ATP synthase assembly protein I